MKSNLPSFLKNIRFYSIRYNVFGERLGKTSKYYIDKNSRYFMKKPVNILSVLQREIYILKLLNQKKYKWCPKLLYHNHKIFITAHVGSQITAHNIPQNYHKQMKNILKDLKKCYIKHNMTNQTNVSPAIPIRTSFIASNFLCLLPEVYIP